LIFLQKLIFGLPDFFFFFLLIEAVLNMLVHPFRFVNEFIKHDDDDVDDSRVDRTRSLYQASATPTPSTADGVGGGGDTPTLDCAAGGVCGDEGVKIIDDGGPNQDDLTSATPPENSK
jgi:hypothetical protein